MQRVDLHRQPWPALLPRLFAAASPVMATIGLAAMILQTALPADSPASAATLAVFAAIGGIFALGWLGRLWLAPQRAGVASRPRLAYLCSVNGTIDLAAFVLPLAGWLTLAPRDAPLLGLVWVLKYFRHNAGYSLLLRVLQRAAPALGSVVTVFFAVFLVAATLGYLFERDQLPQVFGSIPHAMWWAIVTLTTTGYGDVVPTTLWGRLLAGWVMVGGIVIFALWAGIIANAFAEELRRRHFLRTWDLVAEVPFFRELGAASIADIVRLLQVRDVAAATTLIRKGERGDAMYFIVSGEAKVALGAAAVMLGPGEFFGEMALLFGAPRSADVVITRPSVLLVLDIADFRELAGRRPELTSVIEAEGRRRRQYNLEQHWL